MGRLVQRLFLSNRVAQKPQAMGGFGVLFMIPSLVLITVLAAMFSGNF